MNWGDLLRSPCSSLVAVSFLYFASATALPKQQCYVFRPSIQSKQESEHIDWKCLKFSPHHWKQCWLCFPTVSLLRFTCPFWGWVGTSTTVGMASSFNTVPWASCGQSTQRTPKQDYYLKLAIRKHTLHYTDFFLQIWIKLFSTLMWCFPWRLKMHPTGAENSG